MAKKEKREMGKVITSEGLRMIRGMEGDVTDGRWSERWVRGSCWLEKGAGEGHG